VVKAINRLMTAVRSWTIGMTSATRAQAHDVTKSALAAVLIGYTLTSWSD